MMLFVTPPQDAAHIREFCARFNEGLRVEYKGTFDDNVRRNLAKVVSSFANSLGGVLVVGVNTVNGAVQPPIEGFEVPAEELTLTVENICLQGINPPLIPRITMIPGDVPNRKFLVIEVDESWEAPHAIENSKRVYVRTGNAANPYDLADVELIIDLVKRRTEPSFKREHLIVVAGKRAATVVADADTHLEVNIGPLYPRRVLCTNDEVWAFLRDNRYRGAHYFPFQTLRRVDDGVASFNRNQQYSQISAFGLLFTRRVMIVRHQEGEADALLVGDVFHPLFKLLHCAKSFYGSVGYRGNINVSVAMHNVRTQKMIFLDDPYRFHDVEDYQCFEDGVLVSQQSSAELLRQGGAQELVQDILRQLCWSFWQSGQEFPTAELRRYMDRVIREMGA